MRVTLFTFLFVLLLSLALAAAPQKAIVVTFEDPNTPQSAVDDAMQAIKDAGGVVTHEYSVYFSSRPALIKRPRLTLHRSLQRLCSEGIRVGN